MRIAYDIIGSREKAIALLGVNVKDPEKAAEEIMKRHKNVKSVLQKLAERKGTFRLYPCKLIKGEDNTEVIHKEYGYLIKVDPRKAYFSPREATERQRIASMVKPGENILVMFAGVGPFSIAISKKEPTCKIVNVEINENAVSYAEENIKLNNLKNVKNVCCDVRNMKEGKFDRIIMPLVEKAIEYLDVAFSHSKKGSIIHLYGLSDNLEERVKNIAQKMGVNYRIIKKQKVLPYAPRIWKIRLDIEII